ncbi:MAG: hemolysin family protein [Dermatophilaceae bacterium]|nr:hemolysin family protein [Intrasporangiaceae bacterium]
MSIALSITVGVLVVFLITVLTGYFVAQEFAFLAVDRTRLNARAAGGGPEADKASLVLDVTRRTSFMLSGAQLGITVTGLLVGYAAEPLIGAAFGDLLDDTVSRTVALAIGGILALLFSTFIQMLFGELYPKNYAIAEPDRVAHWLAPSTRIYLMVFGPLIWVFDRAAERLLRIFGQEPVHDVEQAASAADLIHVVTESAEQGELDEGLAELLERIIDFPQRDVEHAMIPRSRVDILRGDDTVAHARDKMTHDHTRYPVLDDDERILGVIHLVDILSLDPESTAPIANHVREPLVLSDVTSLPEAARQMQWRSRLACVVDEFGTFTGIVTMEDLAEEIVGEIEDEHDGEPDAGIRETPEGWVMPADLHLDEVEEALDIELPQEEKETIGGLVIERCGRLPEVGECVEIELPIDSDDLVALATPPRRWVAARILELENFVPSRLVLSLHQGDREADQAEGARSPRPHTSGFGDRSGGERS